MNAGVGVLRGYLANAEKVRVRGVEFDGSARVHRSITFYAAAAYTDGRVHVVPRRAAAARRYRRAAGEGHLGLGAAGHLEAGGVRSAANTQRRGRCSAAPARSSAPFDASYRIVVLVERQRLALPDRRRLHAAQRARGRALDRQLDVLRSGRATCSTRTTTSC